MITRFFSLFLLVLLSVTLRAQTPPPPFELKSGDRVAFVGDTFIEREQYEGWIELMLTTRFPDRDVTFRNLGWSADTPAGDSRFGRSLLQAGREPADEGWNQLVRQIEETKPTVVFFGYGMASSFDGESGLARFKADYNRLLDVVERVSPGARIVLLPPLPHENLGAPWKMPATHNAELAAYGSAVRDLATDRKARFVPLYQLLQSRGPTAPKLTQNGIHLTGAGYRTVAEILEDQLFGPGAPGAWRTSGQAETLRQAILKKNTFYFHRSRPANMAYIFGFRKKEQGKNATEVFQFDGMIVDEEKRIAQLRSLRSVNVPDVPEHIGNLTAVLTPQPRPTFDVAEGFEVTLWAENPMLDKPTQMAFDPQGRLWVTSSELYPQIEPGQATTDKIIVLEDTTGQGKADKATVFADGLLIPTGLAPGDGGVYVAQSTELLFFKDTDGDGKADERRIVLSGFGTEDVHHNLHTLRWGPDGRLYMNQSVYTRTDTETPQGVVRLKAGGVFRFDPRDLTMEVLFRGWVNTWGHQFDAFGQSFLTDGAGGRGITWAIPGATYQTLAPARRVLQSVSAGNYPKFAGLEIVRSVAFPADWQGDMITGDFRAHRVVHFKIAEQGAGYTTTAMPDLMRTTSDSFRPIDMRFGPDGALYIADWSNPIIQHGEVDFRDPRRDKSHGRIWRVTAKGQATLKKVDLIQLSNSELLSRLTSPNSYDEEQSRRVLVERGAAKVLPDLKTWAAKLAATDESARLRVLWMEEAFNQTDPSLLGQLLAAKDPRVRAAAVRAMPSSGMMDELAKLVTDENLRVRVEALRALGKRPTARSAELALSVVTSKLDPFVDYSLWLTLNELAEPWLAAVKSGAWKVEGREAQLEFGLKSVEPALAGDVLGQLVAQRGIPRDGSGPWIELIATAGGPKELGVLLDAVVQSKLDGPATVRALAALAEAARLRDVQPASGRESIVTLLKTTDEKIRVAALQLAGAWKAKALVPSLTEIARDPASATAVRSAAFKALREVGGPEAIAALKTLTTPNLPPAVWHEAVLTLASLDAEAALPDVLRVLQATTDETQAQALWRSLLSIRGMSPLLVQKLPDTEIAAAVARAGLRPAREGTQHQALVPILLAKAGLKLSGTPLTTEQMQALAAEALAKGDAARGEQLYRRSDLVCMTCHAIGGAGGKLGPDLTSIGASAPADYLVESILYPNAKIKEGYHSVLITTNDGRDLNGMITRETATEVVLRDATNAETSIPVSAIARRTSVGSLMPAGLTDGLLPEERLDLIKFLSQLGRPGEYDAAQGGVARVWSVYTITSLNEHLGMQRVVHGDTTLSDWVSVYSLVNGSLPVSVLNAANRDPGSVRGVYVATRFDSAAGGAVTFTLNGMVKTAWLNGSPVKVGPSFTVQASAGSNLLVFQLDQDHPFTPLKLTASGVAFSLQ
jgi:putative heme-binding domain-containing protein